MLTTLTVLLWMLTVQQVGAVDKTNHPQYILSNTQHAPLPAYVHCQQHLPQLCAEGLLCHHKHCTHVHKHTVESIPFPPPFVTNSFT